MKEFKIRCHALSKIMAGEIGLTESQQKEFDEFAERKNGNGKPLTAIMEAKLKSLTNKKENPQLPTGAQTYCKMWLKTNLFKPRKEDWKISVIEKGLICEQDGIDLACDVYGFFKDEFFKNEEQFENDFMEGEPDILHQEIVRDIKNSWDILTFPMFDDELPNDDYWWQLQGYMILTGFKKASVDYVLIDTPMPLVMLDLKKLYYQSGGVTEEWTPEKYEFLYPNYRFDDIPKEQRIKSFTFDLDLTAEEKIKDRVLMCRKYIEKLIEKQNGDKTRINIPG